MLFYFDIYLLILHLLLIIRQLQAFLSANYLQLSYTLDEDTNKSVTFPVRPQRIVEKRHTQTYKKS